MMIQEYNSICPKCGNIQTYYRALTGSIYGDCPRCLDNVCACGYKLQQQDVTNWEEIEHRIRGFEGSPGVKSL